MPKRFYPRKTLLLGTALIVLAAVLTAPLYGSEGNTAPRAHAKVDLYDPSGKTVGFVSSRGRAER